MVATIEVAFKLCSNFMPNERPTTDQLINILAKEPENQLILKSLAVSQITALENSDKLFLCEWHSCTFNFLAVRAYYI